MLMRTMPVRPVPTNAVSLSFAEGVARAARAAPPLQQLRIALAHRTAGACVGARVLQLAGFYRASDGRRAQLVCDSPPAPIEGSAIYLALAAGLWKMMLSAVH